MTRRKRAVSAVRDLGVPAHVVLSTVAIWLVVGVPVALHFRSFDLPANYDLFVGWAAGGFASAFLYVLFACE